MNQFKCTKCGETVDRIFDGVCIPCGRRDLTPEGNTPWCSKCGVVVVKDPDNELCSECEQSKTEYWLGE